MPGVFVSKESFYNSIMPVVGKFNQLHNNGKVIIQDILILENIIIPVQIFFMAILEKNIDICL